MKKFKFKRKCPKCKQANVSNRFVKKGGIYFETTGRPAIKANRNLIQRCCDTCLYHWDEKA